MRYRAAAAPLIYLSAIACGGDTSAVEVTVVPISKSQQGKLKACKTVGMTQLEMLDCISRTSRSIASSIAGKQRSLCTGDVCKQAADSAARATRACMKPCDDRGETPGPKEAMSCVNGCLTPKS